MKTKNLYQITEPFLAIEAQQEISNAKTGQAIYTSDENYTIKEITENSFKCVTSFMMPWRSERKILNKNQIQDLLEQGKAEII